jgi:hypothetical protein
VGADGQKNIDTDNRSMAKNSIRLMVVRRRKRFSPMTDTIGQTSVIFADGSIPLV